MKLFINGIVKNLQRKEKYILEKMYHKNDIKKNKNI